MTIRLKFTHQDFQARAAESVCGIFTGQPNTDSLLAASEGRAFPVIPNSELRITRSDILANLRNIQRGNGLTESESLDGLRFTVEMETGTGKTYTYIKTIHELQARYGWRKYIIVVPSIAIREGVSKTFQSTNEHFKQDYRDNIDYFIYNSDNIGQVQGFAEEGGISVMIINSQAFNSQTESRRIRQESDSLGSRKAIDIIAVTRPIVIIDEPQSVEGDKTVKALEDFRPLFTLRYSATPRDYYNLVYRLDAVDAYNKKLVKKICVTGMTMTNISAQGSYVYVKGIIKSEHDPEAIIEFDARQSAGIRRVTRKVVDGANLYEMSGGLDEYRAGYIIRSINALTNTVEFLNGLKVAPGEISGLTNEDQFRRLQIRETIERHLRKESQLYSQGIKVLSLFFIDSVEKYRSYAGDEAVPGIYARMFEEEYREAVREFQREVSGEYAGYLAGIEAVRTHEGYFSVDKKNHMTDSKITSRKDGTTDDISAFDLIMRDKEKLLVLDPKKSPVRFIFSHSALREGWDNPNVFQICALRNSTSDIRRKQEVGRGLRLCVNQNGDRVDSEIAGAGVQDVNELTVIASESYAAMVKGLQDEYKEVTGSSLGVPPIFDTRRARTGRVNRRILESPEFTEFWRKINRKPVYSVSFDGGEFIRGCVSELNKEMNISRAMITVEHGTMTADGSGVTFTRDSRRTIEAEYRVGNVRYDVVGRIAGTTELPRRVIAEILKGVDRETFGMYRRNPDIFITEAARIILARKNSVSSARIAYKLLDTPACTEDFRDTCDIMRADSMTAETPKRGLYDLTACDSKVERDFAVEADSEETLFAHIKLPASFIIPTPGRGYIPDWGIITKDGRVFVAETKGVTDKSGLRFSEEAKISCAEKFFREAGVRYTVASSFDGLMSRIQG